MSVWIASNHMSPASCMSVSANFSACFLTSFQMMVEKDWETFLPRSFSNVTPLTLLSSLWSTLQPVFSARESLSKGRSLSSRSLPIRPLGEQIGRKFEVDEEVLLSQEVMVGRDIAHRPLLERFSRSSTGVLRTLYSSRGDSSVQEPYCPWILFGLFCCSPLRLSTSSTATTFSFTSSRDWAKIKVGIKCIRINMLHDYNWSLLIVHSLLISLITWTIIHLWRKFLMSSGKMSTCRPKSAAWLLVRVPTSSTTLKGEYSMRKG